MEYKPLSKAEELRLIKLWQKTRDVAARNILVVAHERLVMGVAKKYYPPGLRGKRREKFQQDLIQAGNEGLMRAADKYELEAGTRFFTYAKWWVRAYVRREYYKLIGSNLRMRGDGPDFISLDHRGPSKDDDSDGRTLLDKLPDPNAGPEIELGLTDEPDACDDLRQVMDRLDERERFIIEQRFFGEARVIREEIGLKLQFKFGRRISRERVRQLEVGAIAKLRQLLLDRWGDEHRAEVVSLSSKRKTPEKPWVPTEIEKRILRAMAACGDNPLGFESFRITGYVNMDGGEPIGTVSVGRHCGRLADKGIIERRRARCKRNFFKLKENGCTLETSAEPIAAVGQ